MARKRYETAFIPAASCPTQYPDVDSLLISIESFSLDDSKSLKRLVEGDIQYRRRSKSVNQDKFSEEPGPSISSFYQKTEFERTGDNSSKEQGSFVKKSLYQNVLQMTRDSRSGSPVRKMPIISLSEPLRPKRVYMKSYSSIQSSSGCSSTNSSSSVTNDLQPKSLRVIPRRNLFTLMKLNSASSLDSIDSAKSEDFKYLGKSGPGPPSSLKLLSPISDKSPIEPMASQGLVLKETLNDPVQNTSILGYPWKKTNFLMAAEQLTDLPWEMPKLKRKLALLVDSGISLDYRGSHDSEQTQEKVTESRDFPLMRTKEHLLRTSMKYAGSSIFREDKSLRVIKVETQATLPKSVLKVKENFQLEDLENAGNEGRKYDDSNLERPTHQPIPTNFGTSQLSPDLPPPPEVPHTLPLKPDRFKMKLDFGDISSKKFRGYQLIDPNINLETQDWFHGAITRIEAEEILRRTKEGSFLVRNCESSVYNRYSLSLKSSRGFIHVRIEPNPSSSMFSLGDEEFESVPKLVQHFMSHRLTIKGAEHVLLKYPVLMNLL